MPDRTALRGEPEFNMKTLTLMLALTACHLAQAGEIADHYRRETNHVQTSYVFTGPKMPPPTNGISEIGIERAGCFGPCPVYVCIIRSNGTVRFHGGGHVDKIGEWVTTIDPYKFNRLADFIAESGYAQLQDTFPFSVTDADTVYTTFVMKGRRKVFMNYASSGPPKLWALQQLIDGLLAGAEWHRSTVAPKEKQ
jgi:hypothetical protein